MASFLTQLINSIVDMPGKFVDVMLHDPISAVLVGMGAVFVGLAVLAGGVLTLSAVVEFLTPGRPDREHRPQAR
jgi:Na+-transporting methylmalonyl-CoA/oxaloacetate decarboxylase gamma subunit